MATHSSILAWEIPWTEEPTWLLHGSSPWGCKKSDANTCVQGYLLSPAEQELGFEASDSLYFLRNPRTSSILLLANEVVREMPFLLLLKKKNNL